MRNFQGQTFTVHKDNVRNCPEREAQLFQNLPLRVKEKVGFPFTTEEITQAILNNQIPEFFANVDQLPPPKPPRTRLQAQQEQQQIPTRNDVTAPTDLSDDEDDIDNPPDPQPGSSRTVRFNI